MYRLDLNPNPTLLKAEGPKWSLCPRYCWVILSGGRFSELHAIYQGCRALTSVLVRLSRSDISLTHKFCRLLLSLAITYIAHSVYAVARLKTARNWLRVWGCKAYLCLCVRCRGIVKRHWDQRRSIVHWEDSVIWRSPCRRKTLSTLYPRTTTSWQH